MISQPMIRSATIALSLSLLVLAGADAARAGDLNPPPGPLGPTMKPLDALLPGTCISDLPGSADAVHVITEPGLYVVTSDVVGEPGKSDIAIELNPALPAGEYRVAIDLGGHVVEGVPTADAGLDFRTPAPGQKVVAEVVSSGDVTGRVAGFDGPGIRCVGDVDLSVSDVHVSQCGGHGIECSNTGRVELTDVDVASCALDGVHVSGADECRVRVHVADCGGDGMDVSNGRRLSACCLGSSGEDGVETRIERCSGNGVVVSNVTDVALSLHVEQCLLDGIHVTGFDECRVRPVVADCDGDGLEASNGRKLSACCLGSSGEDGVEVLFARCGGNGALVSSVDDVDLSMRVEQSLQDGVHVTNALQCVVGGEFLDCGGDGVEGDGCVFMAIGSKGMPTSKGPKSKSKSSSHRVVNPGGNGVVLTGCAEVSIDDLECSDAVLDGVHLDSSGLAGVSSSVSLQSVSVVRCGGDGVECSMESTGTMDCLACVASRCGGDGLHVSGAARVAVEDWRDEDCDGDGIEYRSGPAAEPRVACLRCSSFGAGGSGVLLEGTTSSLTAELVRVTVRDAFGNAIDARNNLQLGRLSLEDCEVSGAGGDGVACDQTRLKWSRTNAVECGACGARVTNTDSVSIDGVHAENNGEEGLRVSGGGAGKVSMQDFHFVSNGFGAPGGAAGVSIDSVSSIQCRNGECRSNAGDGIRLADFDRDGMLDLVVCSANVGHGVHAESAGGLPLGRCRVTNAMCDSNGGDGISLEATTGGEVSQCTVTSNTGLGVAIYGNGHVVRCNTCSSNSGGAMLVPVPGNVVGPLIDELSVGGNCNPAANYVY